MYQKGNNKIILALFLGDYSKQFYLREISKLTRIPLKTTHRLVSSLEKDKILKSTVSGKNKYFKLNFGNPQTKLCLLEAEIYKTSIFIGEYPLFKTFLKELSTSSLLIVFGSFAKFKAEKDSDLDLLVVLKRKEDLPFYLLGYNIHKVELLEKNFIKAIENNETLIREIAENHIILNDHSFYVNIMWSFYGRR
ncbi:nucleotidyltransferase domain-containing protein [Candidatus Woesearchaeota archaeon]|nr:nucleotidyltransferase domain-containing protein [Candidatus Woesearchaeota archaeon]